MIVTHADMRKYGYCNKGAREFFQKHGLDWALFVKEGLPSEDLLATGDAMAAQLVEKVEEAASGQQ